jgi:hypothetical protein
MILATMRVIAYDIPTDYIGEDTTLKFFAVVYQGFDPEFWCRVPLSS